MGVSYDAIVIGLGAIGGAASYHLARRGQRVLGLDAHPRGHALGSSHGKSRIIRTAYTTPEYVPLVQRAFGQWNQLAIESGRDLLVMTGMLLVGPPSTPMIDGPILSARRHGLPYELLGPSEVAARFPGFRLTDELVAVFEPGAGLLRPEVCTAAHLDLAARHGAELRHEEPVRVWAIDGAGVRVITDRDTYTAGRLVIAPGPWAGQLLADLRLPLTVLRVVNIHVDPPRPAWYGPDRCPVFGWEVPEGHFYGFPSFPGEGLKLGKDPSPADVCTPETVRRQVTDDELAPFREMLARYMPGAAGRVLWTLTCLYTMTPDHHFVVDHHPRYRQVVVGCGFSGHGFKFAPVIGDALADLALDQPTALPIDFLNASRFPHLRTA
jgi:sarcosine oxidase